MTETTEFDTAAEMQKALDRKKAAYGIPYKPLLETTTVDQDGIIVDRIERDEALDDAAETWRRKHADIDPVNEILAKDERPSSVWNNFVPTDSQIAAFLLAFFLFLGFGIDQAMRGDLAAMRFEGNGASGR